MNATTEPTAGRREPEELWSVVVVYDDAQTRQRAMKVCDHLVQRFWSEVEFKFHWWRTDFLEDDTMATTAVGDAADADFIVVSSSAEHELSPFVKNWFDAWIARRQGREGAFVDLTETGAVSAVHSQHTKLFLRHVASRAAMDYLTKVPSAITGKLPDSVESAGLRAGQITSVLDDILHLPPPPQFDLQR
jgi:hypothetical protein